MLWKQERYEVMRFDLVLLVWVQVCSWEEVVHRTQKMPVRIRSAGRIRDMSLNLLAASSASADRTTYAPI